MPLVFTRAILPRYCDCTLVAAASGALRVGTGAGDVPFELDTAAVGGAGGSGVAGCFFLRLVKKPIVTQMRERARQDAASRGCSSGLLNERALLAHFALAQKLQKTDSEKKEEGEREEER